MPAIIGGEGCLRERGLGDGGIEGVAGTMYSEEQRREAREEGEDAERKWGKSCEP